MIECSIVDAHAEGAIRFLSEQDGGAERRLGGSYVAFSDTGFDILLEDFEFGLRKVVDGTEGRIEAID